MSIKVAHFSDLHYSAENLLEADKCFEAAVTGAILNSVDCAIVTGDSTDHAMDAHSPAVHALAVQLRRLSNHCPVLMLQGTFSHEPPGFLRTLAMVGGKYGIAVADGISRWMLEGNQFVPFHDHGIARLVISALPTINKAHVAALVEDAPDETAVEVRAIIKNLLLSWDQFHQALRVKGIPTMILSHGTVFNCINEHGVPMAGADHELGIDTLFGAGADVVALGHIHKHQHWEQSVMLSMKEVRQVIAYAGSIGRFHHGEQGDKGWLSWTLGAPEGTLMELMVTPSRRNVDFVFEGPPDLDEIRSRLHECEGAHVRIQYSIDEEHRHHVNRAAIRKLLENAADVQIEGRTCIVQRQRAEGISKVSLSEKLAMWATVTATPNVEELQERLQMISANPVDQVVEESVARVQASCA